MSIDLEKEAIASPEAESVVVGEIESANHAAFIDGASASLGGTAALAVAGVGLLPSLIVGLAAGAAYMLVRRQALS